MARTKFVGILLLTFAVVVVVDLMPLLALAGEQP
jgi:hypothetical protein